jgi:hypothetical protein
VLVPPAGGWKVVRAISKILHQLENFIDTVKQTHSATAKNSIRQELLWVRDRVIQAMIQI